MAKKAAPPTKDTGQNTPAPASGPASHGHGGDGHGPAAHGAHGHGGLAINHEPRDVPVRPLIWGMVAVGLTTVFALVFVWFVYFGFNQELPENMAEPTAIIESRLPTGPLLEENPEANTERVIAEQETRLENYGWVDRQREIVHLPIDEAMQLILERGVELEQTE